MYQTTHATFVEGSVRTSFFGVSSDRRGAPGSIYAAENCSSTLSSLVLQVRVNASHGVYKLFSTEALTRPDHGKGGVGAGRWQM